MNKFLESVKKIVINSKNKVVGFLKTNKLAYHNFKRQAAAKEKLSQEKINDTLAASLKNAKHSKNKNRFKQAKKKNINDILSEHLMKLGYDQTPRQFNKKMLFYSFLFSCFLALVLIVFALILNSPLGAFFIFFIAIFTLGFITSYLLFYLVFFFYVDLIMYRRVKQIEEALPDFLQLTAANMSAGMTMDRALWFAVRPRFGILAKEMETVAKATLAGEELENAMVEFSKKYDSRVLRESVNLIVAGLNSGGEMADLLNKIASNIKDTDLMRKEISASMMTYVIFIGAAAILAAPVLFGLSTELLVIIKKITSAVALNSSSMSSMFSFNFSGDSISVDSFKKFSILMLCISSFFSAAIISTIRKGSIKEGLRMIPVFIVVSITLYLLSIWVLDGVLGGLF